jgi:hypothetical protein
MPGNAVMAVVLIAIALHQAPRRRSVMVVEPVGEPARRGRRRTAV